MPYLVGTQGGRALAESDHLLFPLCVEMVVGAFRASWLIVKDVMEGGERTPTELIHIAATHPILPGHLRHGLPAEQANTACTRRLHCGETERTWASMGIVSPRGRKSDILGFAEGRKSEMNAWF
jgi:hypothetical protein